MRLAFSQAFIPKFRNLSNPCARSCTIAPAAQTRIRAVSVASILPSHLILPLVAILSTHPSIPTTLRNAPSAFLSASLLSSISLLSPSSFPDAVLRNAPAALTLLLLHPSQTPPSPKLLYAFLVGALGTTLGAVIASCLLPNPALAASYAATYIGGSANFVAVASVLSLSRESTVAAMSVDLAAMTVYFTALFAFAARVHSSEREALDSENGRVNVVTVVVPLLLTVSIVVFTNALKLPSSLTLLATTSLATLVSSVQRIHPFLKDTPRLSTLALNLFFAALGATARLSAVASASPAVCLFATVVLVVHALFLYLVGSCWLRIPAKELLLASNANVGGASTAAAFAACLGWHSLVHGAVAVGTLGYVLGTPVGLLIYRVLGGSPV